jgi:hypothetical protein
MNSVQRFTQAYAQAPWRKQMQWIGVFLLILILGSLVAGIYLNVTARATAIGRSIQRMRGDIEALERTIADLESQLAFIKSKGEMEKRARELGFRPVEGDEIVYLTVPGYPGRQPAVLAQPPGPSLSPATYLPQDYTQSLFDWLRERVFEPAAPLMEVRP